MKKINKRQAKEVYMSEIFPGKKCKCASKPKVLTVQSHKEIPTVGNAGRVYKWRSIKCPECNEAWSTYEFSSDDRGAIKEVQFSPDRIVKVENLLSVQEASEKLGYARPSIYHKIEKEKLASVKIGGSPYVVFDEEITPSNKPLK